MTRAALEHVLRAAAAITNERDFIVIGSQAVLGQFPDAPPELLASIEVDVYPRLAPEKSDLIDGAIGELSTFHQTYGYYAHGIDDSTATLPTGWEERLVPVRCAGVGDATGWCLEIHDLAVSKLVAGREKDVAFVRTLLREGMARATTVATRLQSLRAPAAAAALADALLKRLKSELLADRQ
jgi:hypothetical protein